MKSEQDKKIRSTVVWHFPHLMFWMGGTKYLLQVCRELQRNYNVVVVTNKGESTILQRFASSGITVKTTSYFATDSVFYWLLFPIFFMFDLVQSWKYLKSSQIVICTAFPSNLICAVSGLFMRRSFHFLCFEPYIFFHNKEYIASLPMMKRLFVSVLGFFYGWTDLWSARRASTISTIDSYKALLIEQVYKIIPNNIGTGVDLTFFCKRNADKLKKVYGNVPVIFHASDYTPLKGTTDAIRIFNLVHQRYADALLLISSTQPDSLSKRVYENLVDTLHLKHSVKFVGLIPEDELPLYYSLATCYLSTSSDPMTATNLPVKEALACQTPALRALPSSGDVIDGKSGYLINPKKHLEAANKIIQLIESPSLRNAMGTYGRKVIELRYSWHRTASQLLDVLKTNQDYL